jgi:stearoyl-CoA desaturase (Delta-9 desaturase)
LSQLATPRGLPRPAAPPRGESPAAPGPRRLPNWLRCVPFVLLHLAPLAAFLTGVDLRSLLLCAACYLVNVVGATVGYHRYFAHHSYKTSRAFQFVLACLGCTALQKGPLWWAAQHRHHHRHSDTPEDVHSPVAGGIIEELDREDACVSWAEFDAAFVAGRE